MKNVTRESEQISMLEWIGSKMIEYQRKVGTKRGDEEKYNDIA